MTENPNQQHTMKERPILFSGPMVRAILEGRKTQTRRVVKNQNELIYQPCLDSKDRDDPNNWLMPYRKGWHEALGRESFDGMNVRPIPCPYGQPGDKLIVKEAAWMWCAKVISGLTKRTKRPKISWIETRNNPPIYCADHPTKPVHIPASGVERIGGLEYQWHKKNARFLPRWASRITLEILSVRVERLQDITEADAEAEGIDFIRRHPDADETLKASKLYEFLWESINGPDSWLANPWVWVIGFKRVESEVAA